MVVIPHSQIDVENIQHLAPDIAGRLVRRPEDLPNEIKQSIAMYKSNVLIPLEVCCLLYPFNMHYMCNFSEFYN